MPKVLLETTCLFEIIPFYGHYMKLVKNLQGLNKQNHYITARISMTLEIIMDDIGKLPHSIHIVPCNTNKMTDHHPQM
jgi:hypothetical protein